MELLTLEVTMLSDWHIGTGSSGEGNIDRRIARDEDGFPFIPAKSLTGILRDSCEEVLSYLGLDADPEMDNWATYIFGRANVSSKLRVRAAKMDIASRGYLLSFDVTERSVLSKALATVKPGVTIDPLSGRAKDDHLSFLEVARPMVLTANVELLDSTPEVLSLVVSACRLVEYIGAKRRRGLGRCSMRLYNADGVDLMEENQLAEYQRVLSLLPAARTDVANSVDTSREVVDNREEQITLTFTALSPLLFPKEKMGNVVSSHDYIPGSAILPIVHEAISRAGFDAQSLIRAGRVKVSRGLPVFRDKTSLPTPFVISVVKNDQASFVNNSLTQMEDVITKQVRTGWITKGSGDNTLVLHRVPFVSNTHNSVFDALQRPSEDVGGVFTYEGIAPGQAFRASVKLPTSIADVLFHDDEFGDDSRLMMTRTGIGTSRKDDYGDVEVTWDRESLTQETPVSLVGNSLQVWCVADVVLPHNPGIGLAESAKRAIAQAMGVSESGLSLDVARTRVRPMRVDSWHGRWGLPRTTMFGIAAGSCISVTWKDGELSNASVSELVREGIGVRRAEGFGLVVVNHELLSISSGKIESQDVEKSLWKRSSADQLSPALSRAISMAIRDSVRIRATEIAQRAPSELPRWWKPSNADGLNHQFAILRRLTMQTISPMSEDSKQQFLHDFDAWDKGSKEAAWELMNNESTIWNELGDFSHPLGIGVESIPSHIRDALWIEAVRVLVENIHRRRTRSAR